MFVPPSPSQPDDTPGSAHRATPQSGRKPGGGRESPSGAGQTTRMVDKRRLGQVPAGCPAAGNDGNSSNGGGGARLPGAVVANQEKPTPVSLSEAKQVRI